MAVLGMILLVIACMVVGAIVVAIAGAIIAFICSAWNH